MGAKPATILARWAGLLLAVSGSPALAETPRGTAGVDVGLIFTDNLFLSPTRKEADAILQVRPTMSVSRRGARVNADVNFSPVGYLYAGQQEFNDVQFVLDAGVSWEVIDRWFFLDVDARANQVAIDPSNRFGGSRARTGFDSAVNSDAFTQVATISVRPRIEWPVARGRFATVSFEPGIGSVFQASTAESTTGNRTGVSDTRLTVTSGPVFVSTPWSFDWRSRVFDTETEQRSGGFSFTQGYVFDRRFRLDAVLGYDTGTYVAANGEDAGLRWELRLNWTPKPASAFQLGFGDAFFGPFWSMQARHQHKRWALQASYRVSVENATSSLLDQRVVPLVDLFGDPITNPLEGDVLAANTSSPTLTDEDFLNHQINLAVAWRYRRNSAQFQWTGAQREYSGGETLDHQWSFNLSRSLSRRLNAAIGLQYWSHSEENRVGSDFTQQAVDLTLGYRLGPKATLNTRIARQSRDGDFSLDAFSEHRLTLDLSLQL